MVNSNYGFGIFLSFLLYLPPISAESVPDKTPYTVIPYAKYIPLELLMEIYQIQEAITSLQTQDPDLAFQLGNALENKLHESQVIALQRIAERIQEIDEEIKALNTLRPIDPRLKVLEQEYQHFKAALNSNLTPDDRCLNEIDHLYFELIVWGNIQEAPEILPVLEDYTPRLKTTVIHVTIDDKNRIRQEHPVPIAQQDPLHLYPSVRLRMPRLFR